MLGPSFTRSKNVVFEVSGGRAVLMDTAGREMITLNPVGTRVWEQLAEPLRFRDLGDALSAAHPDVPRDTIDTDVQAFLDEMIDAGLLKCDAQG